uniref:CPG4 domain-containing protein n=1 Tax=Parastrongyloides trichosuri TaxID=131310 RepID=A0A0N4Z4Q3_PARTI
MNNYSYIFLALLLCTKVSNLLSKQSFAKILHLTYDTGHILASEELEVKRRGSISIGDINCATNIGLKLEKQLKANNLEYRGNILETLVNETKYEDICRQVDICMQSLLHCPKEEVQAPTAIIALLKLFCDVKKEATKNNIQCMSNMERMYLEKCQKGCSKMEILKSEGSGSRDMSCIFAYCSTICLANQVSECDSKEDLRNLYYYLNGASMLLGVETALRDDVLPTQMLEAYNKIPLKCREMMDKSGKDIYFKKIVIIFLVSASMGEFK